MIVTTNYVQPPYAMTHLEPCRQLKGSICENIKTTKAPSQTYAAVLNTRMLRDLVKKFHLNQFLLYVQSWS